MAEYKLSLIRHAHADPAKIFKEDKTRSLSIQGLKQIDSLGDVIIETKEVIDFFIISPATRTKETFDALSLKINSPSGYEYMDAIYDGEVDLLIKKIHMESMNYSHIGVIGHNPMLSKIATSFTGKNVVINSSGWICIATSSLKAIEIDGSSIIGAHEVIVF